MSRHSELLRLVVAKTMDDRSATVFALGWFAAAAPESALEGLVNALDELRLQTGPEGLPGLLQERWGRDVAGGH